MNKLTTFQMVVMGSFIIFLLAGVATFSLFKGGNKNALPELTIWGTIPRKVMLEVAELPEVKEAGITFEYIQINGATLEQEFIEALASGKSPDIVMFPHDLIYKEHNKLLTIPFEYISERKFRETFIDGADVFLSSEGVLGIPFVVDPLLMYFNRDMFSSKGIAVPPKNWDEFFTLAPIFNEKNEAGNLKKTVVALGEVVNVTNFKDILSALILQAGNPITEISSQGKLQATLTEKRNLESSPGEAALRFYTEFSNPVKPAFSWNKSFLDSKDAFINGDLGTYFGFGSELASIRARNPNLNFDVTTLPQIRDSQKNLTFSKISVLVVPKASRNQQAAVVVSLALGGKSVASTIASSLSLSPARRDLLQVLPTEAHLSTFYTSSIMSHVWIDPSPKESLLVFKDMVESIISGKARLNNAVSRAESELNFLINENAQ